MFLQTNYKDNPRVYHGLSPLRLHPPSPTPNKILAGGSLVTTVWNYKFGGERCRESKLFCPNTQYKESHNQRTQTCSYSLYFVIPNNLLQMWLPTCRRYLSCATQRYASATWNCTDHCPPLLEHGQLLSVCPDIWQIVALYHRHLRHCTIAW